VLCRGQKQQITIHEHNPTLAAVCAIFTKQHAITFSYDADEFEEIHFEYAPGMLTLHEFLEALHIKYGISASKASEDNYLFIVDRSEIQFCGLVTDETGLPLSDTAITHKESMVAITDAAGRFNLNIPRNTVLHFSRYGMASKDVRVDLLNEGCPTIFLEEDFTQLQEVVVTDYLTRGMVKNEDSSIKLSPKGLGILPGLVESDIFQSLQLIPGVSSPTEDPTNLHIRGGTPDQNLVLFDGIKMYLNDHFFNQISSFNPYIIKSANVYRGGTSVRYGERISGVIDIKSTDDLFDEFKVGGGLNLTSADAYFKIPLSEKIGVLVSGRRSSTDLFETPLFRRLSEKVFENSRLSVAEDNQIEPSNSSFIDYSFSDLNFKVIWKPRNHQKLQLSLLHIANKLRSGNVNRNGDSEERVADRLAQKNLGIGFMWTKSKPNKTNKTFQAYISSYSSDYGYDFEGFRDNSDFKLVASTFNRIIDIGYDLSFNIPIKENHSVLLGQQSTVKGFDVNSDTEFTGTFFSEPFSRKSQIFNELTNLIGYSEYRYRSPKLFISAGLRAGIYNNFLDFLVEPRLYASKQISDRMRLTGSAEIKNQSYGQFYLAQVEFDFFGPLPTSNNFWGALNTDGTGITILRSRQLTLGSLYDYNGWRVELEGYYKTIANSIPFNDNLIPNLYELRQESDVDTGTSRRFGVDLLLKKRFENYRVWLSYAFSSNLNTFSDIQERTFTDSYNQPHHLNISQTYFWKNMEFGLGWTYASGLPYTKIVEGTMGEVDQIRAGNKINSKRLPAYHRLDISALYKFNINRKIKGKFGFSARNLYNRRKPVKLDYSVSNLDNENLTLASSERQPLGFVGDMVLRINF